MKADNHTSFQVSTNDDDTPISPPVIRVVRSKNVRPRNAIDDDIQRVACSLIHLIVERDPVRGKQFLERLEMSLNK